MKQSSPLDYEAATNLPFKEWVKQATFHSSSHFVCNEEGKLLTDFVGKLENFQADFDHICKQVNVPPITLPAKNKSEHGSYTDYYDAATAEYVYDRFREDFERFGYSKTLEK